MENLIKLLHKNKIFKDILSNLQSGRNCSVNGLWGSSANFFISSILLEQLKSSSTRARLLLVTPHIEEAKEDFEDLNTFLEGHVSLFQAFENLVEQANENDSEIQSQRLQIINQIIHDSSLKKLDIIVSPIHAVLQPVPCKESISKNVISIRKNHEHPVEELVAWLHDHNYQSVYQVENSGEYATRGGIIDIYSYASEYPYRIEYFGDEVESIRKFNIESQLSEDTLNECQIFSIIELKDTCLNYTSGEKASLLSYLNKETTIILKEPASLEEQANKLLNSFNDSEFFSFSDISGQFDSFVKTTITKLPIASSNGQYTFHVKSADSFSQSVQIIVTEISNIINANKNTVILCNNTAEEHRFREIINELDLKNKDSLNLQIGYIRNGFQFTEIQTAILAHHEIFHRYKQRREIKKPVHTRAIDSFLELKKGDYVVHLSHGIGRFLGMETIEEEGYKREFLIIEYDEGTKIYVPAAKIELIQKYIGSSEHHPRLDKIGSKHWEVRKKRVEDAVSDIASDLLCVQALRNSKEGIVYPEDNDWQKEFEAEFIYEETYDQLRTMEDIKCDMESKRPMDRLICGDVGYGKTELAMRAAFKAVMNGKQVAMLVPTTILAQQHYKTFSERMADYPVKIEVISRFKTHKEQREVIEKTSAGLIDILIGTHRILQKDVYFKDLGLVVIDEEQRFGVAHKERLKQMRRLVDVLTLTATPIPRTLHMSLMGIKDISSLNTPPLGRQAITTRIIRFDQKYIQQAIRLELNRDGQVYFVHNRVYNIERIARNLSEIVPEARILTVHGQMDEKLMEQRMKDFVNGKADMLVSTTIIESGLDIPNVNTIFINCADTFGLADLHQLRGRVGRYKHHAFAYIIIPDDRPITPDAEKRVKAIEEFAELGAGFKIAMRDLEIRGAGNILGTEQHGHIAAVGYELYCRLLEIAVRKARHESVEEPVDVSIDLEIESFIPRGYIYDDSIKMDIYRRLNRSTSFDEITAISEELVDRFGEIPISVRNLLSENKLRIIAQKSKIRSIVRVNNILYIRVADLKKAENCLYNLKKYIRIINEDTLHLRLPYNRIKPEDLLEYLNKSIKTKV